MLPAWRLKKLSHAPLIERLERLIGVGIALSAETDPKRLLDQILDNAIDLGGSDGGTLYLVEENHLVIELMRNRSLQINVGGLHGVKSHLPPIPLWKEDKTQNLHHVVCYAYHQREPVNITDSTDTTKFDFSGTRAFDKNLNYRSISFLAVPLLNHEQEVIGVLQLINALDRDTGEIIPFENTSERIVSALTSMAAIALTKDRLIHDTKQLFDTLTHVMAEIIDKKSEHTGNHCRRIPEITMLLAEAAHNHNEGPIQDFRMKDSDRYEIEVASWLHDCGKLGTPDHIIDKATKLSSIIDRIEMLALRVELEKEARRSAWLWNWLESNGQDVDALREEMDRGVGPIVAELENDLAFARHANFGKEVMTAKDAERIERMKSPTGKIRGPLLTDDEAFHLSIPRGTLTFEERKRIQDHIIVSQEILEALPFPRHLKNVPEYAGNHHERVDGKGYPKGLKKEEMSIPSRIIAIADIFEALTAGDRPYKKGLLLSEALSILIKMADEGHIDPDLFQIFLLHKVHLQYAHQEMATHQIDEGLSSTIVDAYLKRSAA